MHSTKQATLDSTSRRLPVLPRYQPEIADRGVRHIGSSFPPLQRPTPHLVVKRSRHPSPGKLSHHG
jgi:hypothetical protein